MADPERSSKTEKNRQQRMKRKERRKLGKEELIQALDQKRTENKALLEENANLKKSISELSKKIEDLTKDLNFEKSEVWKNMGWLIRKNGFL